LINVTRHSLFDVSPSLSFAFAHMTTQSKSLRLTEMTEQLHPIHPMVPPNILLKKWEDSWFDEEEHPDVLLIQAYQAGADAELEACCEWLQDPDLNVDTYKLRVAHRPKPDMSNNTSVLFVGLKLTGYINWPWLWILSPMWISLLLAIAFLSIDDHAIKVSSPR